MNRCSTILHEDAVLIMQQWGEWAKSGNVVNSLAYPSIHPLFSVLAPEKPAVPDELSLCVDSCLAEIIAKNETLGVVTALYYLTGMSYQGLSEMLEKQGYSISRQNVSALVDCGTNSVYSAICI